MAKAAPKRISKAPKFTVKQAAKLTDTEKMKAALATDQAHLQAKTGSGEALFFDNGCFTPARAWKERYDDCRLVGWSKIWY